MEIARVLEFLRGGETAAVVSAQVTGMGGIGKTEVCKAALTLVRGTARLYRLLYRYPRSGKPHGTGLSHWPRAGCRERRGIRAVDDLAPKGLILP